MKGGARTLLVAIAMAIVVAPLGFGPPVAAQTPAAPISPVPGPTAPSAAAGALVPPSATVTAPPVPAAPTAPEVQKGQLYLSASLTADGQALQAGPLRWRVFEEKADAQGRHRLVASSNEAAPRLNLPVGTYLVHVALDLSSAVRRVTVTRQPSSERLILNAGALRIVGLLGDKPINPSKLLIAIYVPEAGNSEAKLVLPSARAGDLIAVPEGSYHIVSTLLDTAGYAGAQKSGVGNKTNSVVSADLRVQAGKLTDATLKHRSAVLTLKLVNSPGGEALANTAFTILTPGGDVIRELIGAFPSVVLAEGEYVVIARHDTKTYPSTFKVTSTLDRDVEVLVK